MRIAVQSTRPSEVATELLVVALPKLEADPEADAWRAPTRVAAVDRALDGQINRVVSSGDFRGRVADAQMLYAAVGLPARRILLLGMGPEAELDADSFRRLAGRAVNAATDRHIAELVISTPRTRRVRPAAAAQALAEGAILAGYRFDTYRRAAKPDDEPSPVDSVTLLVDRAADLSPSRSAAKIGSVLAESQNVARRLSDEPANALPPAELARAAQRVGREVGLRVKVMEPAELERRGMGAILAVGGGSANSPRLIAMEHEPRRTASKKGARKRTGARSLPTVCLVGKGITFDSGGISIKPSAAMDEMKHDMSGAAAVVGALRACALLKLPIRVVGVIAAAENLPSSTAYRPGDVVTSMSKKTIEILNTDAEGRVVLADALHYARTEYEPDAMVDLATLTGACVVALGKWATGMFGNHDGLVEALRRAGEATAERVWQLPLWEVHRKAVRSQVADIKNTTGREGSSSTAAAFLANFVGDTPWVHLDIAGTGWGVKGSPYQKRGATGVGVRLLLELLQDWRAKAVV